MLDIPTLSYFNTSVVKPTWLRGVKFVRIPAHLVYQQYLWNIAVQSAVGCYNLLFNIRCSIGLLTARGKIVAKQECWGMRSSCLIGSASLARFDSNLVPLSPPHRPYLKRISPWSWPRLGSRQCSKTPNVYLAHVARYRRCSKICFRSRFSQCVIYMRFNEKQFCFPWQEVTKLYLFCRTKTSSLVVLYDFRDLTGNSSPIMTKHMVVHRRLHRFVAGVFYAINHSFLVLFSCSILVRCHQHQR